MSRAHSRSVASLSLFLLISPLLPLSHALTPPRTPNFSRERLIPTTKTIMADNMSVLKYWIWNIPSDGHVTAADFTLVVDGQTKPTYLAARYNPVSMENMWKEQRTKIISIIFPEAVTYIHDAQYEGCISLQRMRLPPNLKVIGSRAFRNCFSLMELVIPDSVTDIQGSAFSAGKKLGDSYLEGVPAYKYEAFNALTVVIVKGWRMHPRFSRRNHGSIFTEAVGTGQMVVSSKTVYA